MTHYKTFYDKEYLGSWDLPPGRDVTVTIESVKGAELDNGKGKKNKKPVIKFVGKEKKFISNVTNSNAIAGMHGPMVEDWSGKKIALYITQTRDPSSGSQIDCIRVRPTVPKGKAAADTVSEPSGAVSDIPARIEDCATLEALEELADSFTKEEAIAHTAAYGQRKAALLDGEV